jgi:predicted  nucleic acid-binding Zn-ribbon protein
MRFLLAISFLLIFTSLPAQDNNTPVPFTLGDRDRLMRNEQNLKSLRIEMNAKFEAVNAKFEAIDKRFDAIDNRFVAIDNRFSAMDSKFDSLQKQIDYNSTLLFVLLAAVMSLIGFVIYDRRTAIKPVQKEQEEQAEEIRKLQRENNLFRESLKKAGLL